MKFTFELDHIGVAVESLEKGKSFWEALGLGPMSRETVLSEKVNVGFFELHDGVRIELLEPTEKDSPIGKFLENKGPGIQQICFRVEDIRATLKMLKSKGIQLINEEPKPGAHGCQVAFIHPKSTGGILVELSQPPAVKGASK